MAGCIRTVVFLLLVVALLCPFCSAPTLLAANGVSAARGTPDLKTTLEKGLKARRRAEFDFIHHVIAMVDNGELPRSLVESTFLWARKEAAAKRSYPFIYFERGLKARAKKLRIQV
jgi:hypothetical protein